MGQLLLYVAAALVIAAIVFGVTVMLGGGDPGLTPAEPDGKAVPLPSDRPLGEDDLIRTKFDIAFRGYRMSQVDQALQRAAYDIGYKGELIGVLEAEVIALREGRMADADMLRRAREAALAPSVVADDAAAITEPPATAESAGESAAGQRPAAEPAAGKKDAAASGEKEAASGKREVASGSKEAASGKNEDNDRDGEPAERR